MQLPHFGNYVALQAVPGYAALAWVGGAGGPDPSSPMAWLFLLIEIVAEWLLGLMWSPVRRRVLMRLRRRPVRSQKRPARTKRSTARRPLPPPDGVLTDIGAPFRQLAEIADPDVVPPGFRHSTLGESRG